ncbi:MAG: hypothetical protein MK105_02405 [Crocinitomicaceae bacterium]|nr:hypothetical protein [Crocinitomicaceae bacterium]
MRIDVQALRELIFYWIKSDEDLRKHLRDLQIKLLIERLVKGLSFEEMARIYDSRPQEVKVIFEAILVKIENSMSKQVASILRTVNNYQEGKNQRSDFGRIFLN